MIPVKYMDGLAGAGGSNLHQKLIVGRWRRSVDHHQLVVIEMKKRWRRCHTFTGTDAGFTVHFDSEGHGFSVGGSYRALVAQPLLPPPVRR